ncbi:predicted protein [Bathycoccus prasinos]|uniref:Uncharacterized protein n=1 Tax=Bathycoccus prasinos TaxID=41875 RepID=K8EV72_9CHLO|nr:predicted protein [Bathycoccus prasinos]CCO16360.1 predicted protein [Bathycoccus prasinos]|eukprot:XP_007513835.1 predicted protein [Bathycoccus prasinos]
MFALSSSCIAASSSTRRTSKSSLRRRRNEGPVCFVSSKSGLEIDSAEKTKKSSSSFSSSIQNTFSSASLKACSLSTSFFLFQTENAFAASADAEELKQFLIGFWNFRTGDVTSILLYTVAPIALPYLIFSQLTKQKQEKQIEILEQGGWVEFMRERELDVNILTLVQINAFVAAAEKGVLDDAMVAEFVRQLKLNEQWKKSTINVEDPRAAAATRRARAEAILEAREERAKQESSSS